MKDPTQPDSVLTLFEAAKRLKVSDRTLWQLAKDDAVPHFRVGKQYRFLSRALDEWARNQATVGTHDRVAELKHEASRLGMMLVTADEMEGRADVAARTRQGGDDDK